MIVVFVFVYFALSDVGDELGGRDTQSPSLVWYWKHC